MLERIIRAGQVARLKELGYSVVESEVPLPSPIGLKPVLVDYETSVAEQCRLLGVKVNIDLSDHRDLDRPPVKRWGWIYWVRVGESAGSDFRGLSTREGLAFHREYPKAVYESCFELLNSRFDGHEESIPLLCVGGGHVRLFLRLCRRCTRTFAYCSK